MKREDFEKARQITKKLEAVEELKRRVLKAFEATEAVIVVEGKGADNVKLVHNYGTASDLDKQLFGWIEEAAEEFIDIRIKELEEELEKI